MVWIEITRIIMTEMSCVVQAMLPNETDQKTILWIVFPSNEWELIEPFMPTPAKVGRPREVELREVWNAIQYIVSGGIQWRLLPKDFPPLSTVGIDSTGFATKVCLI